MPAENDQRRIRVAPALWALVEAAATARHTTPAEIMAEAIREKFGPRHDLVEAMRVVADLASEHADIMDKIDLLFLHAAGHTDDIDRNTM
jgi:hypothetical protein